MKNMYEELSDYIIDKIDVIDKEIDLLQIQKVVYQDIKLKLIDLIKKEVEEWVK